MKFINFQRWLVLKIMNGAQIWNGMFTHEVNRRAIVAFQEAFPDNQDADFAGTKIEEMKTFYRAGMHVMLSVWLTAVSLLISLVALFVSVIALIISLVVK